MNDMNTKKDFFNADGYALHIVEEHVGACLMSVMVNVETADDLYKFMAEECAYILVDDMRNKILTPLQFNAVRNSLAKLLGELFA